MTEEIPKMLKISQLATETGFPVSTIRHYINEGLLGPPKRKSRNMAWYDSRVIPRIHLVKRLQDELFLPLRMIKKLLQTTDNLNFEEYNLFVEVRKRFEEDEEKLPEMRHIPYSRIEGNLALAPDDIPIMQEIGIISPKTRNGELYFNELDYRIIKAFSDCRRTGFSDAMGFTAKDFTMYKDMIKSLIRLESRLFIQRVTKYLGANEIVELIQKGIPAVNDVISALHEKFAMEELKEILALEAGNGKTGENQDPDRNGSQG